MKLAVIIPTKNEEVSLPLLLGSLKEQTIKNVEIIVADASSTDKTRAIAKSFGCQIVQGGSLSFGRNNGARWAIKKGAQVLCYIDADVILPSESFLKKSIQEMKKRNLDLAATLQLPFAYSKKINPQKVIATTKKSSVKKLVLFYKTANSIISASEHTKRPFMQQCFFEKASVFEKIGGFDENMEFGEDSAYAKFIVKKCFHFGVLKEPKKIFVSPRRLVSDGFWKMLCKYLYFNFLAICCPKKVMKGQIQYYSKKSKKRKGTQQ